MPCDRRCLECRKIQADIQAKLQLSQPSLLYAKRPCNRKNFWHNFGTTFNNTSIYAEFYGGSVWESNPNSPLLTLDASRRCRFRQIPIGVNWSQFPALSSNARNFLGSLRSLEKPLEWPKRQARSHSEGSPHLQKRMAFTG
jgi:hypothetical protein